MRQGFRVIDMDTHVTPSSEVLLRYAGSQLKARQEELTPYIRMVKTLPGRGHPETDYPILRVKPIPYERVAGQKEGARVETTGAGSKGALEGRVDNIAGKGIHVGIQHDNSAGRLKDMDVEGVDLDFIIPGTWATGSSALDVSLCQLLYEAYHRYMADYCSADSRRLKGLILAQGADPQWSARTIRELAKDDWPAAVWAVLPEGMPIDDPDLAPVFEAMDEAGFPLVHHSFFYEPPYFPGYRDIWGNSVVARTAAHMWGAERLLAYVLISGMLDRYPTLRVATVETGHGWLPHWIIRLTAQSHFVKGAMPEGVKHTPMEYVQMGRVFCGIENHEGVAMTKAVIDLLGDDVLLYQSDFPHPESLFPNSTDTVIGWKSVIGETATRKLMGENAMRFLRLTSSPWESSSG
ncbi:MAG TPA: amidohydrolase family protein [Chloroflexota bacterium]|nr:amidohydrolase family protein [Chloroflexota bacterium]